MSFQDKSIQCSDCGAIFAFTAEQQEFFQSKDYTNDPKRCPSCREARKSERYGNRIAAVPAAKCFRQHAPSVAKIAKCHLSPDKVGQCIVANATAMSELVDS
jgi:DNA-directed RNA polymerase subunit RPC12/RpoP